LSAAFSADVKDCVVPESAELLLDDLPNQRCALLDTLLELGLDLVQGVHGLHDRSEVNVPFLQKLDNLDCQDTANVEAADVARLVVHGQYSIVSELVYKIKFTVSIYRVLVFSLIV